MTGSRQWQPLARLLGAIAIDEFLTTYWERRYYYVRKRDNPELLSFAQRAFSLDDADRILATTGPQIRDSIRISKVGQSVPRESFSTARHDGLAEFDVDRVLALYNDGATITLNRVHQRADQLETLCNELSACLRARVNANAYLTPPNGQGFRAHSDTHDVLILQIDGQKRWRIQSHLEYLASPRLPNQAVSDPLKETRWDTLTLHAGEAIYIPRGLLHEGVADSSHSLHITLGIHSYTWSDLIRDVLSRAESEDCLLRQSAVVPISEFDRSYEAVASKVAHFLSSPQRAKALALERTSQHSASRPNRGRLRHTAQSPHVMLSTRVQRRRTANVHLHATGEVVELRFGTKTLSLPAYTEPHLRMICDRTSLTPLDLPGTLDDDGRLTLIRRLLAEGLLETLPESRDH